MEAAGASEITRRDLLGGPQATDSPPIVRERPVGLGHPVNVFFLLDGAAAAVARLDQLVGELLFHGLAGALASLLEAVALWHGQPVRAALCVAPPGLSCDSNLFREAFSDGGGALYSVVWARAGAPRRRRPRLDGLGRFDDLERLVIDEVAR